MKFIKHIIVFLCILSTNFASAQVTFEAKVSKKKLGINERLRIDFIMNKDGDNFNPPSLKISQLLEDPVKPLTTYG